MRPLTDETPKPLLKVNGISLIEQHLFKLSDAGYQHVVINVAWLGNQIIQALGNGEKYKLTLHFSDEKRALETAGGIVNAMPILNQLLADTNEFTVINGDIYTSYDFNQLPSLSGENMAHLVLVTNPEHNPDGDFGLEGEKVTRLQKNQFTFSGIAVYHKDMFSHLNREKLALAPILFDYASKQKVSGQLHNGQWFDVGTPERLNDLNQMVR